MHTIVEAQQLSKNFGETIALDNVSFTVPPGLSMVVGPNGSGKSTLFRMASGLLRPDLGELKILGVEPYRSFRELHGRATFAFERTNLPKTLKVRDFLRGIEEARGSKNMDEIVNIFHLERWLDKKFGELSQGYKRRIIVSQAFIGDPELILIDEPFSNLDPKARMELSIIIERMKEEKSIILITHLFGAVNPQYIVIMHQGSLIESGKAEKFGLGTNEITIKMDDETRKVTNLNEVEKLVASGGKIIEIKTKSLDELIYEYTR